MPSDDARHVENLVVLRVTTALGMLEKRYQISGSAAISFLAGRSGSQGHSCFYAGSKNTNGLQICINLWNKLSKKYCHLILWFWLIRFQGTTDLIQFGSILVQAFKQHQLVGGCPVLILFDPHQDQSLRLSFIPSHNIKDLLETFLSCWINLFNFGAHVYRWIQYQGMGLSPLFTNLFITSFPK